MSTRTTSVSLSDLSSTGVLLQHTEAVAIAREAALSAVRGELSHIPAPDDLRLGSDGSISVAGHTPTAGGDLRRAARLLAALLAHAAPEVMAPATFRLILARALAEDESAFESVEQFAEALTPFADPDPAAVVQSVVATWRAKTGGAPLEQFVVREDRSDDDNGRAAELAVAADAPAPVEAPRPAPRPLLFTPRPRATPPQASQVPAAPPVAMQAPRRSSRAQLAVLVAAALLVALLPALWLSRRAPEQTGRTEPRVEVGQPQTSDQTPQVQPQTQAALADAAPPPVVAGTTTAPSESAPPSARREATSPRSSALPPARRVETNAAQPTQVLANAAFSPAFASSASGMFYHSGTGPGSAIMRADTDRRGMVLHVTSIVDDGGSNFHPRPSPDGRAIAFDSDRDGERGVYVADASGRGVRRVSGPGFAAVPSWSPDGRRIAFVRAEERRPHVWNVWMLDLETGEMSRVTSHQVGQPWGAAWFPDGDRIAYSHEDRLIVKSLTDASVRVFNSPVRGRPVRTPAVSPDGQMIIFQVRRDGVWVLDLSSNSMRRALEDPTAEEFTWSPDGRRVAYHSRRSGTWGVWMLAPR